MSTTSEDSKENSEMEEALEVKENNGIDEKLPESKEEKSTLLERRLPRVNCEERIIFVLDLCREDESTTFQLNEGPSLSFLFMVKRALSFYLHNKKAINASHKYALVLLHESPIWLVDFTSNPREILNELELLKESPPSKNCDLSQIFNLIKNQVTLPSESGDGMLSPPPYIVRTILLYGRSQCLPQFLDGKDSFAELTGNAHFFLDVLYAHEPASDDNKCEGIFDLLCALDCSGWSYVFEVGRNATQFHNLCAKLVAHPLHRPAQRDAHYTLLVAAKD